MNKVVGRFDLIGHSQVKSFRYNIANLSTIKIFAEATLLYYFFIVDSTQNVIIFR